MLGWGTCKYFSYAQSIIFSLCIAYFSLKLVVQILRTEYQIIVIYVFKVLSYEKTTKKGFSQKKSKPPGCGREK